MSAETSTGTLFAISEIESVQNKPYKDVIREKTGASRMWDYLSYNEAGELELNHVPFMALIERYSTPLEVVDTTIIGKRFNEWQHIVHTAADKAQYPGDFEYFYASKANMSAEITTSAYAAGWQAETSGAQDLANIHWLYRHGLVDNNLKIICNGFKLPPQAYGQRTNDTDRALPGVEFIDSPTERTNEVSYADYITHMRALGFDITPILDSGELDYFAQKSEIPPMNVGLRLKFGKVQNDEELAAQVSRHGMSWEELQESADKIDSTEHLNLTTFHAMVGAAETIPVDTFAESVIFAAGKYFELKKNHASLTHFNIGGGVPPLSTNYDHEGLMEKIMLGIREKADAAGLPAPTLMFEFGSFVASEAGFHAFKVVQSKNNNPGGTEPDWAIIDGGLMAAIPDMLLIDKSDFPILAANNANQQAQAVKLGDLTCDSDGQFPPKSVEGQTVALPEGEDNHIVICGVGAYQEILAGIRGAHHCGLLEAAEVVITERDGKKTIYSQPRQTSGTAQQLLGYAENAADNLRLLKKKSGNE